MKGTSQLCTNACDLMVNASYLFTFLPYIPLTKRTQEERVAHEDKSL